MGLGALLALKGSFLLLHGSLDPLSHEGVSCAATKTAINERIIPSSCQI
jgi:hypothetical protein